MSNEKISKALHISLDPTAEKDNSKQIVKQIQVEKKDGIDEDFDIARSNMLELIGNGKDAMDGIMKVALETDSPRAYEVASLMLKTISELNKDLLVLHEKTRGAKKEKVTNITNNSIYVGSTTDLQNLINTERATNKNEDA
jgi:hypothetical protein